LLDTIAKFQQSEYTFNVVGFIREYLASIHYAEELRRMIEEDHYQ